MLPSAAGDMGSAVTHISRAGSTHVSFKDPVSDLVENVLFSPSIASPRENRRSSHFRYSRRVEMRRLSFEEEESKRKCLKKCSSRLVKCMQRICSFMRCSKCFKKSSQTIHPESPRSLPPFEEGSQVAAAPLSPRGLEGQGPDRGAVALDPDAPLSAHEIEVMHPDWIANRILAKVTGNREAILLKFTTHEGAFVLRDQILAIARSDISDVDSERLPLRSCILGSEELGYGVYLGRYPTSKVIGTSIKGNIGHIRNLIKVCSEMQGAYRQDPKIVKDSGLTLLDISTSGTDSLFSEIMIPASTLGDRAFEYDIETRFDKVFFLLDKALLENTFTLVHCVSGQNRSPAIILMWLINRFDLTYDEAFAFLSKIRPGIDPAFQSAVKKYAIRLAEYRSDVRRGK